MWGPSISELAVIGKHGPLVDGRVSSLKDDAVQSRFLGGVVGVCFHVFSLQGNDQGLSPVV